jgi:hypothetical protein
VCSGRLTVDAHTVLLICGGNLDGEVLQRCLATRHGTTAEPERALG